MEMTIDNNGQVKISNEVISSIVAIAINETEGFSLATESFLNKVLLRNETVIRVDMTDDETEITADVFVKYGLKINDEVKKLQANILENLEIMTSLNIKAVNINVVSLMKETSEIK